MYSFFTFWGCFNTLNGRCAGIRSGRFLYHILDYRNFFQEDNLDSYIDLYNLEQSYFDETWTEVIDEDADPFD
jgi:hypothetical protein